MNFLQFAVWGAYLTSMGTYLASVGLGSKIGLFYAMQGIVSIFMPALMGIVADRWVPAQKLLGICHLLAAVFLGWAGYYGLVSGADVEFGKLFTLYSVSVAFYMPTIALSNSTAYAILVNNGYNTIKDFPPIRTVGTVGFIIAMWFVNFAGIRDGLFTLNFSGGAGFISFQDNYNQFFVSAVLGLLLFLYVFTLPEVPVNQRGAKKSLYEALGLRAFSLFKDKRMAIFFVFSMLLGVSLQITNGYANPFISSFKGIEGFEDTWGANNANALVSISQISETLCILLIPYFLQKFGIKKVMLISMFAWVLRFGLFAVGDPGSGVWMFVLSMLVYGVAFDFFNVSGSLYVDNETHKSIRSSAQGLFMMMTNGFGATIGMLAAGAVINHFVYARDTALEQLEGWNASWHIFAVYALIVALLFGILFKYKHNPREVEEILEDTAI